MTRWNVCFAIGALAVFAVAISPALDRRADVSFAWHMGQHLLILFVGPLLLVAARPFSIYAAIAMKTSTAALIRVTRPLHVLAHPIVTLAAFVSVLWVTHYSGLYNYALEHPWAHVAEHALYALTGTLFWLPVLAPPPLRPLPFPVRLLYVMLALPQGALLGLALGSSHDVLYAHYAAVVSRAHALEDQSNAAAVMWIGGGLTIFVAFLATFGAWAARENRRSLAIVVFGLLLFPVRAAASPSGEGATLYLTQCASCHGARGQGSDLAPNLIGRSAADIHFMLDTGRMPAAEPHDNEVSHPVRLSERQILEIVRYVQSFSPHHDTQLPKVERGNVARGRALFNENCAHCHGAAGNGASIGYDNVAPSLMHATAFQVGEAIRAGPEQMPRFGPDVLSDRDVDDIASYVDFVQTKSNAPQSIDSGGIALAHIGPVSEGLIAWIFGIGLLTLFIRSIGTSTTNDRS